MKCQKCLKFNRKINKNSLKTAKNWKKKHRKSACFIVNIVRNYSTWPILTFFWAFLRKIIAFTLIKTPRTPSAQKVVLMEIFSGYKAILRKQSYDYLKPMRNLRLQSLPKDSSIIPNDQNHNFYIKFLIKK